MQGIEQMLAGTAVVANSGVSGFPRARATVSTAATGDSATTTAATASAAGGSTITASDFLTLLVTEMKNQDPTQPTDPNAYIQQLVQVNSLQQLIGINSGISSLDTTVGGPGRSTSPVTGAGA